MKKWENVSKTILIRLVSFWHIISVKVEIRYCVRTTLVKIKQFRFAVHTLCQIWTLKENIDKNKAKTSDIIDNVLRG